MYWSRVLLRPVKSAPSCKLYLAQRGFPNRKGGGKVL